MADQYYITYTGNEVVTLGRAGVFQKGTTATVDKDTAELARSMGEFSVTTEREGDKSAAAPGKKSEGKAEQKSEPKVEAKSEAKAEAKKDDKPADEAPKAEAKSEPAAS